MASDIFFISDTHFDHKNILNFMDADGKKFRGDLFKDVDEMNETMIANWNRVVPVTGKVYHLGDVTFRPKNYARIACRLNGHMRLIVGNHDDVRDFEFSKWFEKITVWRIFKDFDFVATHIPIPPDQFRGKVKCNVHGHIHQNMMPAGTPYINMCVEHRNYTPVHIEELAAEIKRA